MENERSPQPELNPEWKDSIQTGIQDSIDNFELIFNPDPEDPDSPLTPINFSPITLTAGEDEREFGELDPQEQQFVKESFFETLGFDPKNPEQVGNYSFDSPDATWEGEAQVKIFQTERSEENMYLHEVTLPDGTTDYLIAPQDYRL